MTISTHQNQIFSELEISILFRDVALGKYKRNKSYLRVLYEMYRFIRDSRKKGQDDHFPGIKRLSENAEHCERQVQRFLNSPFFFHFGERIFRKGESSCYRLNEYIMKLFETLEKKGVMKNIRDDFDKFHKRFKKFMDLCVISFLEKGMPLLSVLNKLCTKIKRICHPQPREYVTLAIPSILGKQLSKEIKTKPVEPDPISEDFLKITGLLKDRLLLSENETRGFVFKNNLGVVKFCAETLWHRVEKLRWVPRNMASALQDLINKSRRHR